MDRHPSTKHMIQVLMPNPNLQGIQADIAAECNALGMTMLNCLEDGPELTAGLRKLL